MEPRFRIRTALGLVLLVLFALPVSSVTGADLRSAERLTLPASERVTDDVYAAASNVTAGGTVVGDLVAIGGNLSTRGTVSGDVLLAGGTVTIGGTIEDDVRAAGGNMIVTGRVDGDVVMAGGNLQLSGERIGGDAVLAGGTVELAMPVAGNVRIAGGDISISGEIKGNVIVDADRLTIAAGTVIGGDLSYRGPQQATIDASAKIAGKTSYDPRPAKQKDAQPKTAAAFAAAALAWAIGNLLVLLACSLLIGLTFRRYAQTLVHHTVETPWGSAWRGFVALATIPIASIILLVTVLGLPLGIAGLLGYALLLLFAHLLSPILVGSLLHRYITKAEWQVTWKTILLGAVAYSILAWIPFVGWIVRFAALLLTLGSMLRIKVEAARGWR